MGSIKERLKIAANYVHDEEEMRDQLKYAGEAIESEFQKLSEKVGISPDGFFTSTRDRLRQQDEKIEELGRCNDQAHERLHRHSGRIEALEKRVFPKEPEGVPTDKDRPFQVGDTIVFRDYSNIRIVLEVNSDKKQMELMDVPSGSKQITASRPENYTLVYRPRFPAGDKEEAEAKDEKNQ